MVKRKNKPNNKRKKSKKVNDVKQINEQDQEEEHDFGTNDEHTEVDQTEDKNTLTKRPHDEDDSDAEGKPQRKKKKKKPIIKTSDKNGTKSIRQMKREKFAQRQAEAQVVAKDQFKSQCLNYLSQWKYNRDNWKFMKVKQVWLFKNMFSSNLVPDDSWPMLLEYFQSAQGNIRKLILQDANKIIKQLDDWTESQNNVNEEEKEETSSQPTKPSDTAYKRARDLIQCLEE